MWLLLFACAPAPEVEVEHLLEVNDFFLPRAGNDPVVIDGRVVEETTRTTWEREPPGSRSWGDAANGLGNDVVRLLRPPEEEVTVVTEVLEEGGLFPTILDSSGVEVPLEPLVGMDQSTLGWVAVDGFAPGIYTVVSAGQVQPMPLDEDFEVGEWGQVEGFDPAVLEGRAYRVTAELRADGGMALGLVELWLVIESVEGQELTFRLVGAWSSRCNVLRSVATVDAGGVVRWSAEALEADVDPAPIFLTDLAMQVSFDAAGDTARGGTARMVVDSRALDAALDQGLCDWVGGVGVACDDTCPDGATGCLDARAYAIALDEVPGYDLDEELPWCGADLTGVGDIPPITCDFEWDGTLCAVAPVGMSGSLALLSVLLARRRRAREADNSLGTPGPRG